MKINNKNVKITHVHSVTGTSVSSTNKIDRDDIAEILLKVTLNTLILTNNPPKLIS
jgi:hypothetical protein